MTHNLEFPHLMAELGNEIDLRVSMVKVRGWFLFLIPLRSFFIDKILILNKIQGIWPIIHKQSVYKGSLVPQFMLYACKEGS